MDEREREKKFKDSLRQDRRRAQLEGTWPAWQVHTTSSRSSDLTYVSHETYKGLGSIASRSRYTNS